MKTLIDILPTNTLKRFDDTIKNAMQTVPVMYNGFYDIRILLQKLQLPTQYTHHYHFRDRLANAWTIGQYNYFIQHQAYFSQHPQDFQQFKELYILKQSPTINYQQYTDFQQSLYWSINPVVSRLLLSKPMLALACQQDYFLIRNYQLAKTAQRRYSKIMKIDNFKNQQRALCRYRVTDACGLFQRETQILCVKPTMIANLLNEAPPFDKLHFCKKRFAYKENEYYY